jgi:hypothetical protein
MNAGKFLADNKAAIDDLVAKIASDAVMKMPCLALGSIPDVSIKLRALITTAVIAKFEGGEHCTGAWDTDNTFVVTVSSDVDPGETRINVALVLGETKMFTQTGEPK